MEIHGWEGRIVHRSQGHKLQIEEREDLKGHFVTVDDNRIFLTDKAFARLASYLHKYVTDKEMKSK